MNALVRIAAALLVAGAGTVAVAEEPAPLVYTNADLLRLFGPAAAGPAAAPTPTHPDADWSLVESVLQREKERVEAEREHELELLRAAAPEPEPAWVYPVVWRLPFPASLWWQRVWCSYSGSQGTPGVPGVVAPCPTPETWRAYGPSATRSAP